MVSLVFSFCDLIRSIDLERLGEPCKFSNANKQDVRQAVKLHLSLSTNDFLLHLIPSESYQDISHTQTNSQWHRHPPTTRRLSHYSTSEVTAESLSPILVISFAHAVRILHSLKSEIWKRVSVVIVSRTSRHRERTPC